MPLKGAHLLLFLFSGTHDASVEGECRNARSTGDKADCESSELFKRVLVDHLDSMNVSGRFAKGHAVV